MTIHILDGHDRTEIGRRPVTVTVGGVREGELRLEAHGLRDDDAAPLVPRPGRLVLPTVGGRVVVRALPTARATFGEGTLLSVRLFTEPTPHAEGDQVVVQSLEVSGLGFRDLIAIEATGGDRLAVSAINAVADKPIGPLAAAARAAARARLRADRADEPVELRVAVDMSASMAPVLSDGLLSAALDVLAGISQVIGAEEDMSVLLLTDHAVPLPPVPAKDVASETGSRIAHTGLGYGFRSAPPDLPRGRTTRTYVLTDAVPADAHALREHGTSHLVVLGGTADPSAPPGPPPRVPDGLPVTFWPGPERGRDVAKDLLATPSRISELVTSLLCRELAGADR